ncbi:MAG TPA: BrnT family toxin [Terracidiphilus sp.]|nr:BrnT family toxin [Terracidiphilus sp.]
MRQNGSPTWRSTGSTSKTRTWSTKTPDKCTYEAGYKGERRLMDIATVVVRGRLLTLIYTERDADVRVNSFRPASREEREQYEQDKI